MSEELKRTLRTVVQVAVFAAAAAPFVIEASGVAQAGGVAAALAVSAAVTRIMQVEALQPALRWLGLDVTKSEDPLA